MARPIGLGPKTLGLQVPPLLIRGSLVIVLLQIKHSFCVILRADLTEAQFQHIQKTEKEFKPIETDTNPQRSKH